MATENCMVVGTHLYPCHNGKVVEAFPWEEIVMDELADGTLVMEMLYSTNPPLHPPEGYGPYTDTSGIKWRRQHLMPLKDFPKEELEHKEEIAA